MSVFQSKITPSHAPPADLGRAIRGSVGDELVYAIGDIHGRYDLLQLLLKTLAADASTREPARQPILIFCGDYVDRGPDSEKVMSALVWLEAHSEFELHLLKGNHEQVMLRYIDDPLRARDWVNVGGAETLTSYGVAPPKFEDSDVTHNNAHQQLLDRMPASHLRLLQSLKMAVQIGDFAFVHAGIRPRTKLARQSEQDLLWIREEFVTHDGPHEKIIVHGHSFTSHEPVLTDWRIGIDTGSYETGVLTALRLCDGNHGFLSVRA